MKKQSLIIFSSFALAAVTAFGADSTVTLKKVHICCGACVKGIEKSVKDLDGVTVKADEDSESVTLASADKAKLQKAVNALADGGYFGESDNADIKPMAKTGAKGEKVQSLTVEGVHLCCPGCVKGVERAVKNTPGATGHTAKKNAETFQVNGDFNDQKFFEELQKEGLSGKVAKAGK